MNKNIARRHHYLPQSYLSLFTDNGTNGGKFFVLDVKNGNNFYTSPINVAVELDFNRIDIDGFPPDLLENKLAPFEQRAVLAITNTISKEQFPTDDDFSYILNLICLVAVRNPSFRKIFNDAHKKSIDTICDLLVSDRNIFHNHIQKARKNGEDFPEKVSFDEVKQFVEEKRYDVIFSTGSNLNIEFKTFDKILPLLGERIWSLIIAPKEGPEFICSDHPLTIFSKSLSWPVGLGTKNTEVFFPFSRRAGFYGTFEDPLKEIVYAKPGNVATMNSRTLLNANKHVFSTLESFSIWADGKIIDVNVNRFNSKNNRKYIKKSRPKTKTA